MKPTGIAWRAPHGDAPPSPSVPPQASARCAPIGPGERPEHPMPGGSVLTGVSLATPSSPDAACGSILRAQRASEGAPTMRRTFEREAIESHGSATPSPRQSPDGCHRRSVPLPTYEGSNPLASAENFVDDRRVCGGGRSDQPHTRSCRGCPRWRHVDRVVRNGGPHGPRK